MKKIVALLGMFCALQGGAQVCLRTTTSVEFSTLKQFSFNEKIYWRKKFNGENKPKTVYNFFSVYKLDSIWGLGIYGLDIDLMSEKFEKNSGNTFRHRNKVRMGIFLMMEKNIYYAPEYNYIYPNGKLYISFLHLPHKARGDRNTKSRRGSFAAFVSATPSQRFEGYFKFKPFGNVWLGTSFNQRFPVPKISLFAEIELNKRGYDRTKTESSKDLYRGFTIFLGPEYNLKMKNISFNFGIKYEGRNH